MKDQNKKDSKKNETEDQIIKGSLKNNPKENHETVAAEVDDKDSYDIDSNNKESNNIESNDIDADDNESYDMAEDNALNKKDKARFSVLKASFSSRKFKGGAYATALSAIVLVIILFINVFISELDLKIDVSSQDMFTLTDVTKEYVKGMKDDITIYYLAPSGEEDETFSKIVEKYKSLSNRIDVVYKDPVQYPKFASQYTDKEITNDSVIVVNNSNNKAKYVDSIDMVKMEMDYNTFQQYASAFDVEGQITSAIQYVTREDLPVMYIVEGHGEFALSNTLTSALDKNNITTKNLSTITGDKIPEDCSILLINAPQKDYSKEEVDKIKTYLSGGGSAIILVNYTINGFENFNSLLNYYGVKVVDGIIFEDDSDHYSDQYGINLLPTIEEHDITSSIRSKKAYVMVPEAIGLEGTDTKRNTITIEPLMITSDSAYSKVNINNETLEKEDGDINGPFSLGMAVTETYEQTETKLVILGSPYILEEEMLSFAALGNLDIILNSVSFVTDQEEPLAIHARSIMPDMLTVTASDVNFWSALVVVIIPVLVLALGGYICIKRRKR